MAIISRNKQRKLRYGSNQLRYAAVYIALTLVLMLILNIYCSNTSQQIFYQSKHAAMMDKILHVSATLGEQEVLNEDTARSAMEALGNLKTARSGGYMEDLVHHGRVLALVKDLLARVGAVDVQNQHQHQGQ